MYRLRYSIGTFAVIVLLQSFHTRISGVGNQSSFNGVAPSLACDNSRVYLAYASRDSILMRTSGDNGKNFSASMLVALLPQLSVGGGRGPQITITKNRLVIAATDKEGNVHCFSCPRTGQQWEKGGRINDVAGIAKEGFVSIASGGNDELFATWLDLRNNKKNKIVGARSNDGGKTWSKNQIIYNSPEGTVCECCKPSVAVKGNSVIIMFRNLLKGNRDLFLIKSTDGGKTFGKAEQLGNGNWKLNACPMDGGGLVINEDNSVSTVWRRDKIIYSCMPGMKEEQLATGKQCTLSGDKNDQAFAYADEGKIYVSRHGKSPVELGTGIYPQLTSTVKTFVCAWQNDKKVFCSLVER